ncbi:MAG: hypothetical protein AMXMBFR4_09600 [Candidatus Hydrogenedentota bacterium]
MISYTHLWFQFFACHRDFPTRAPIPLVNPNKPLVVLSEPLVIPNEVRDLGHRSVHVLAQIPHFVRDDKRAIVLAIMGTGMTGGWLQRELWAGEAGREPIATVSGSG